MKFPFLKIAVKNLFSKPSTVEYPFKVKEAPAKPNYRGRIAYDAEKCVNCGMCQQVCCPGAITVTKEKVEGGTNIMYAFDLTSCTFCGTCQDFCEEGAIRMTEDYHMVAEDPEDLIVRGVRFQKDIEGILGCTTDCIFCGLCARNCNSNAITVDRATKTWKIDHSLCEKCGRCIGKCPKKALSFMPAAEAEKLQAAREEAKNAPAAPAAKAADKPAAAETKLSCDENCIYCTLCARNCPQEAITVNRAEKTWEIEHEKCVKCGLCIEKCPKKALRFK